MNYPPPPFDAFTHYGMIAITFVVAWRAAETFSGGNAQTQKKARLVFGLVIAISGVAAALGLFSRIDLVPPPFQVVMVALAFCAVGLGFSPVGRSLASHASLGQLVLLQAFRLPLELLMYRAALQGIMPMGFSFAGYNVDIVSGAIALVLGLLLVSKRSVPHWVLMAWNLWGIACLIVIAALAIALSPNAAAAGRDASQVVSWVLHFPYSWLPHVLVIVAVLGHVLITLKLRRG
jgi:hypothetical protein